MPRFVVLRHEVPAEFARGSHFDLMFEVEGELMTWAVDELPTLDGPAVAATPLPHHRIAYLDYEGPVSGGRGTVHRVAHGTCRQIAGKASAAEAREEFEIESPELRGRVIFTAQAVQLKSLSGSGAPV